MKKSKIINLLLLTVSFTAGAKVLNEPINTDLINKMTGYHVSDNANNKLDNISHAFSNDKDVTRGGFGGDDDKKHDGAEQNHHSDDKK